MMMCMGVSSQLCVTCTERYLIITGRGLLVTENKNKIQQIGFPDFITNIYIHRSFYPNFNFFGH